MANEFKELRETFQASSQNQTVTMERRKRIQLSSSPETFVKKNQKSLEPMNYEYKKAFRVSNTYRHNY